MMIIFSHDGSDFNFACAYRVLAGIRGGPEEKKKDQLVHGECIQSSDLKSDICYS